MTQNPAIIELIIQVLKEEDGETIQYILKSIGMEEQMLKQLYFMATDLQVNNLDEERNLIARSPSVKVFWRELINAEHNRKAISKKVWDDIHNNDTLIYNDFDTYWKSNF